MERIRKREEEHQKWPHMMIDVMDLFKGVRAVINAGEKQCDWRKGKDM
jgi:hypothetical protein